LKINALEKELARNNSASEQLQAARNRLSQLLNQYTESNPLVADQRDVIAQLETAANNATNQPLTPPRAGESTVAANFYTELLDLKAQKEVAAAQVDKLKSARAALDEKLRALPEKELQLARIKARKTSLEASESLLASRQREAQIYEESTPGYYRYFPPVAEDVEKTGRLKKLLLFAIAGGMLGALAAIAFVGLREILDDRLKTVADLKRSTRLPLLATLTDLDSLDAVAQAHWAFRTWLALQVKLATDKRRQLVCGFVAAHRQEGVSTWLELLARGAAQRNEAVLVITNRAPENGEVLSLGDVLDCPALLSPSPGEPQWLEAPGDWQWRADRRRQWFSALESWRPAGRLVVLVELTAADSADTLLFAEQMPQLIWLAGSGVARTASTKERLQIFQNAGCRFVGAVLNRETKLFPGL
jgi:hypothetical protein